MTARGMGYSRCPWAWLLRKSPLAVDDLGELGFCLLSFPRISVLQGDFLSFKGRLQVPYKAHMLSQLVSIMKMTTRRGIPPEFD
jgi:hypothetical protein